MTNLHITKFPPPFFSPTTHTRKTMGENTGGAAPGCGEEIHIDFRSLKRENSKWTWFEDIFFYSCPTIQSSKAVEAPRYLNNHVCVCMCVCCRGKQRHRLWSNNKVWAGVTNRWNGQVSHKWRGHWTLNSAF